MTAIAHARKEGIRLGELKLPEQADLYRNHAQLCEELDSMVLLVTHKRWVRARRFYFENGQKSCQNDGP